MSGAPYRHANSEPLALAHVRWYVPTVGLWFLALSAWLLVGSCSLRSASPTLACERVADVTRCAYHDDAPLFPQTRMIHGADIQLSAGPSDEREGIFPIDARRVRLVPGPIYLDTVLGPIRGSNECVTDTRAAVRAFFAGNAGPRMVLRFNEGYGMDVSVLAGAIPALMTGAGLLVALAELFVRTRRIVIDANRRRVSLRSLTKRVEVALGPGETLAVVRNADDVAIVAVDAEGRPMATALGDGLGTRACAAIVAASNRALAGARPRRVGAVAIVPAALALVALAVVHHAVASRPPPAAREAQPRRECVRPAAQSGTDAAPSR